MRVAVLGVAVLVLLGAVYLFWSILQSTLGG